MDDDETTAQAASVMLVLAPKLMWPEPERQGHKSLPPWSRPRMIQERIRLVHAGKWKELLQLTQARKTGNMTRAPATSPCEVIKSEGRALLREVQRGRPGTAWKRVRGLGLLPTGDSTIDSVAAKWGLRASFPTFVPKKGRPKMMFLHYPSVGSRFLLTVVSPPGLLALRPRGPAVPSPTL